MCGSTVRARHGSPLFLSGTESGPLMSLFRSIRYAVEIAALALAFLFIPFLPRSLVVLVASCLGRLSYSIAGRDRATAAANIRLAFGDDITDEEVARLVRSSFESFALVLMDLFWFSFRTKLRVSKYVRFDESYEWSLGSRPFIFMTAHFGNWEVLGLATALKCGRLLSVAAPLENKLADRMLKGMRKGTGQSIVSKHGAVRRLVKELKSGGKVALVIDQNTLPDEGGCFVDLFSVPAPVSMAAASLMLHEECDAAFVCCLPDGKGFYDARLTQRFPAMEREGLTQEELTSRIARALEGAVRQNPEKWLWSYKRWKYVPEGADKAKFPSYSREL